jgi:Holliday junction resolvase-like predicted endonuclease
MSAQSDLGVLGETLCARFFSARGWKILKQNLRTPFGEVDIIIERHGCLWAVEVKTRTALDHDWMPGIISHRQMRRVRNGLVWFAKDCGKYTCHSMKLCLAIVNPSAGKISLYLLPTEE